MIQHRPAVQVRSRVLGENSPDKQKDPSLRYARCPMSWSELHQGLFGAVRLTPSGSSSLRSNAPHLLCRFGRTRLLSENPPDKQKDPSVSWGLFVCLAESQGFEPWEQLPVQRISNPSRSTTPATLQVGAHDSSFAACDESIKAAQHRVFEQLLHKLQ